MALKPVQPLRQFPRLSIHGVYAITPDTMDTDKLVADVELAMTGGVRILQYRNKSAGAALARQQAAALRAVTNQTGTALIINDDPELAIAVSADGVHLGRDDAIAGSSVDFAGLRIQAAQTAQAESPFLIGISCYNDIALAVNAAEAGADYVAFGSFFPSSTKPHAVRADTSLIPAFRRQYDLPVVAIGGITLENAPELLAAGADAVALISALFNAPDICSRAKSFTSLFQENV